MPPTEAEASKRAARAATLAPAPVPVAPAPIASVVPVTPQRATASAINPAFAKLALNDSNSGVASPTPSHLGKLSPPTSPSSPSPPSDGEEVTYEEAKKRAAERAEAALQCSITNRDACEMCSVRSLLLCGESRMSG